MMRKALKFSLLLGLILLFSACGSRHSGGYTYAQSSINARLASIHKEWKNTPYVLGGTSKSKGADCSGFTQSALKSFNAHIPRTTATQMNGGQRVSRSNLRSGDLVFFKTGRGPNGLHVGIYTNSGKFIHLSPRGGVREAALDNVYWKPKFIGARRYIK